jgi:hypothetical protein
MAKFVDGQEVIVLQILMNGTRLDISGICRGLDIRQSKHKNVYKVMVHGVMLRLNEEQLLSVDEYKARKNENT